MTVRSTTMESDSKLLRAPEFFLLVYMVGTYFPLVYRFLPFLGEMRMVLLAGIALVISYSLGKGRYGDIGSYRNRVVMAWSGFLGAIFMSLIVSYDRGLTLQTLEGTFKHFIVFMVLIRIINSRRRLEFVLGTFAACGVAMGVGTIINYLFLGATFDDSYRAMALEAGIFGDPNDLALLFNVTLSVLLFFLIKSRRRFIPLLGILTTIGALMLTYSRGGFVGMCTTGLGFFFLTGKKMKGMAVLALLIAIAFWALTPEDYRDRISTIGDEAKLNEEETVSKTRLTVWKKVIEEGMERPLLGAGAGCSYYIAGLSMKDWHGIHNSFIQVFSETGLLGLGFYLFLFYLPYRQYRRTSRYPHDVKHDDRVRFQFILLALASFAVTASFLPQAYSPILSLFSGLALVQNQLIFTPRRKQKTAPWKSL
jgi:hypothetical protein